MNLPSVKTLEEAFPGKGKEIRALMEGGPTMNYESVIRLELQCYHRHRRCERVMCALNEIIEGHGVESIVPIDSDRPSYDYVNMGDTYATTILMRDDGKFIVACWGDIVEKHMNWYA